MWLIDDSLAVGMFACVMKKNVFETYFWNHLNIGGGFPSATHSNAAGVKSGAVVRRSGPADSMRGVSMMKNSIFNFFSYYT